MKKRVLSLFMALMLCLKLLPTAALAYQLGPVDGTTTQEPTALQQQWGTNHWLLQYDLMFGKGYALSRMGMEGLEAAPTGK